VQSDETEGPRELRFVAISNLGWSEASLKVLQLRYHERLPTAAVYSMANIRRVFFLESDFGLSAIITISS
jgi:hypothetical protein